MNRRSSENDCNRREALQVALTTGAASWLATDQVSAQQSATAPENAPTDAGSQLTIIDTNVHLFRWHFRRLPLDETQLLLKKYRELGIGQAWAGSFEAVLHRDLTTVNERLAEVCAAHDTLVPIGAVNPVLPGWEEDLRRCFETHDMPGVRLYPNYHGYTLDDRRFARLLHTATEAKRFVQIAVALEDARTQHPSVRATDVDVSPLASNANQVAGRRVQLLNYRLSPAVLESLLTKLPGVSCDTARLEGTDGVSQLMAGPAADRCLFGTHAPFLIPEAALIRVHESGELSMAEVRAVLSENATAFARGSHA